MLNSNTNAVNIPRDEDEASSKLSISESILLLFVACFIGTVSNWVFHTLHKPDALVGMLKTLPGMGIFLLCSILGIILSKVVPLKLPSVAWVSFIAIMITLPGFPGSEWVLGHAANVNFLSLATPALAYGGLALATNEFAIARRSGWKLVIVAICVMLGTYLGSVVIADISLKLF